MLFIHICFTESVPQAADGYYIYAIRPTVPAYKVIAVITFIRQNEFAV